MTYVDDAGKTLFDDADLELLEDHGYDTEKMTDEELSKAYDEVRGYYEQLGE